MLSFSSSLLSIVIESPAKIYHYVWSQSSASPVLHHRNQDHEHTVLGQQSLESCPHRKLDCPLCAEGSPAAVQAISRDFGTPCVDLAVHRISAFEYKERRSQLWIWMLANPGNRGGRSNPWVVPPPFSTWWHCWIVGLHCWCPPLIQTPHIRPPGLRTNPPCNLFTTTLTNVTTPWQAAPNDCCLPVRDSGTQIGFLCWGFGKKGRRWDSIVGEDLDSGGWKEETLCPPPCRLLCFTRGGRAKINIRSPLWWKVAFADSPNDILLIWNSLPPQTCGKFLASQDAAEVFPSKLRKCCLAGRKLRWQRRRKRIKRNSGEAAALSQERADIVHFGDQSNVFENVEKMQL